jgi:alpha-galactosidase
MTRVALVGAGSVEFTAELVAGILRFPELADVTLALHDIHEERLRTAGAVARSMNSALGARASIEEHLDRRAALEGAEHVISTMRVGGHAGLALDFEIPARYGVRQTMGDTLGPGAIARGLCTIPALLGVARDMEDVCPDAWLYNYTNPMAILCWAVFEGSAIQRVVGLCRSIENTAHELAEIVGVPFDEVSFDGAGLNHQAWLLRLERRDSGESLYPRLAEIVDADPEGLGRRVRVEAFRRLGYFPSESSEHFADLVPWFLPHPDQVERFRIEVGEYLRRSERNLARYDAVRATLAEGGSPEVPDWMEYAPEIIHSIETGTERRVFANVRNDGLIDNLPAGCCVEVSCRVDADGIHPQPVGPIPAQLAALNRTYVNVAELTVRAALEQHVGLVEQAALLDPNTAATLPPGDIVAMCHELILAHAEFVAPGIVDGVRG